MFKIPQNVQLKLTAMVMGTLVLFVPEVAYAQSVGDVIDNFTVPLFQFDFLFSAICYIAGLVLAVWGIFKLKDHVDYPDRTPLSDFVKRFIAGGAFLVAPYMAGVIQGTLLGGGMPALGISSKHAATPGPPGALDTLVIDFVADVAPAMEFLLNTVSILAGLALLMVGISRLTKSMNEGPRGPAGMGTIVTFIAAGALMSSGEMLGALTTSMFGGATSYTYANLSATVISDATDRERIEVVIEGLMTFIAIVGYIAFIRGWFVLKAFADGSQNSSLAQGLTFLIGGAVAINLGNLINALATTLGLSALNFT